MEWCKSKEVQVELQEHRRAIGVPESLGPYLLWWPKASWYLLKCESSHFPLNIKRVRGERIYCEINIMIEVPSFFEQLGSLLL